MGKCALLLLPRNSTDTIVDGLVIVGLWQKFRLSSRPLLTPAHQGAGEAKSGKSGCPGSPFERFWWD